MVEVINDKNRNINKEDEGNNGVRSLRAEITSCHTAMFTFAGSKRALRALLRRPLPRSGTTLRVPKFRNVLAT